MNIEKFNKTKSESLSKYNKDCAFFDLITREWIDYLKVVIENISDEKLDNLIDKKIFDYPDSKYIYINQKICYPLIEKYSSSATLSHEVTLYYREYEDLFKNEDYEFFYTSDQLDLLESDPDVNEDYEYSETQAAYVMEYASARYYINKEIIPALQKRLEKYGLLVVSGEFSSSEINIKVKNPVNMSKLDQFKLNRRNKKAQRK